MTDTETSRAARARTVRIRRAAERQGLRASLSHRRDPRAIGYGSWTLTKGGEVVAEQLTTEQIEALLAQGVN